MNMNYRPVNRMNNQAGFTIIEVLIALAIFSIGFMAVGALQTKALTTVTSSQTKTLGMEALNAQVDLLKQTPLYATDIWRGGAFVMSDKFANPVPVANGEFTVSWFINNPHTIPNRWTVAPTDLVISEDVMVTLARTKEPGNILNTVEFVKYWVTDN
jgi:prepilin-type N-terminal cleavage/methylation domain-containing protein